MQSIRKGNVQRNLNERKRIGGCVAQKMGGEGGGVGLVHDQPGEGTIDSFIHSFNIAAGALIQTNTLYNGIF